MGHIVTICCSSTTDYCDFGIKNFSTNYSGKYCLDRSVTNKDESQRLTNTISYGMPRCRDDPSQCRWKDDELQRYTTSYKMELLAMYNCAVLIKNQRKQ